MDRPRFALPLLAIAAGCALSAPAAAQVATEDLASGPGTRIDGASRLDRAGSSVAGGDFNGDGRPDVLVGTEGASPEGRFAAGGAHVIFGRLTSPLVDLTTLGGGGVRIDGAGNGSRAGASIAAAGDVNGDGIGDVLIGAPGADLNERENSGAAYVVFGARGTTQTIQLGALGDRGFRIEGADGGDEAGSSVASAGDMNGDGLADLLVGAPYADPGGRSGAGSVHVVFGSASTARVDLSLLGARGFRIDGEQPGDGAGHGLAGSGDVNGDKRPDVIVGAPTAGGVDAGAAYVVHGKTDGDSIYLGGLGAAGHKITGEAEGDGAGRSVADAGDVNDDGSSDQLIGAPHANRGLEGAAYLVRGTASTETIRLRGLGAKGYEMAGSTPTDWVGYAVAGVGDVSGDGVEDHLIGAPKADYSGRGNSGSVYAVFGRRGTKPLDLTAFAPASGFRIDGAAAEDDAGTALAGSGGDIGGTPATDMLIGVPKAANRDRPGSGSVRALYSIAGADDPVFDRLRVTPSRFAYTRRYAGFAAGVFASRHRRRGTRIQYLLRVPARVSMKILRRATGRRSGEVGGDVRCVKPSLETARDARARVCVRHDVVGTVTTRHSERGTKTVRFGGGAGTRPLRPGNYVLEAVARAADGRVHGPLRTKFTILRNH